VAYHQTPQRRTQAEKDEAIFVLGVIRIAHEETMIVRKRALCLLECDTVLSLVLLVLLRIPFEPKIGH